MQSPLRAALLGSQSGLMMFRLPLPPFLPMHLPHLGLVPSGREASLLHTPLYLNQQSLAIPRVWNLRSTPNLFSPLGHHEGRVVVPS